MFVALVDEVGGTAGWIVVVGVVVAFEDSIGLTFVFSDSSFFFFEDEEAEGDVRDFLFNLEPRTTLN